MLNDAFMKRPRVLFFGMQSNFSSPSLLALLTHDIEVAAVVVPASSLLGQKQPSIQRREQPRAAHQVLTLVNTALQPSILQIAWERQLPTWEVQHLSDPGTLATLAAYQPDVICVACFSLLLPRALLAMPRFGCVNVHPSLLPANRGPVPLFWTFREGDARTGVTVHYMDEKLDSGDILAQDVIEVPDGVRYEQLEWRCAEHGGELLARTVWDLYLQRAARVPQDEAKSSYRSFPEHQDYVVYAQKWDARHVYNFIRGVDDWRRPLECYVGEQRLFVRDAISYSQYATEPPPGLAQHHLHEEVIVPCRVGSVRVLLDTTRKLVS